MEENLIPDAGYFNGVPIAALTPQQAMETLLRSVDGEGPVVIRFVNAYSLVLASMDERYGALLKGSGINLSDGLPLTKFLQRAARDGPVFHQIRGPQFFRDALRSGGHAGLRHFLLGGTDETLQRILLKLREEAPECEVVGWHSPPYRVLTSEERHEQDRLIAESGANVIWVGLGTPKQDFEASRINGRLGVTAVGVGAAFDFYAGTKREAPAFVSRLGLEWAFRLVVEPRRLWRRYLFGNARFLRLAIVERRRSTR